MPRTSTLSGTCTTSPPSESPRANARAARTLLRMRLPALDMTVCSIAIIFSQPGELLAEFVPLCLGQVDFVALGEHVQQEYRHIRAGIVRDHAIPSAFAFA